MARGTGLEQFRPRSSQRRRCWSHEQAATSAAAPGRSSTPVADRSGSDGQVAAWATNRQSAQSLGFRARRRVLAKPAEVVKAGPTQDERVEPRDSKLKQRDGVR